MSTFRSTLNAVLLPLGRFIFISLITSCVFSTTHRAMNLWAVVESPAFLIIGPVHIL